MQHLRDTHDGVLPRGCRAGEERCQRPEFRISSPACFVRLMLLTLFNRPVSLYELVGQVLEFLSATEGPAQPVFIESIKVR